jgi:hypothetical protein
MVNETQGKGTVERKKLTITSVGTVAKTADFEKLAFKAKDGDKEYVYACFNSKLFPAIQKGQTVEFDVITSIIGEYTNRKIVQAYGAAGQPIAPVRKAFTGGRSFGKSPEEIRSIEAQVACKLAVELRIADKLSESHPVYTAALAWIMSHIAGSEK